MKAYNKCIDFRTERYMHFLISANFIVLYYSGSKDTKTGRPAVIALPYYIINNICPIQMRWLITYLKNAINNKSVLQTVRERQNLAKDHSESVIFRPRTANATNPYSMDMMIENCSEKYSLCSSVKFLSSKILQWNFTSNPQMQTITGGFQESSN